MTGRALIMWILENGAEDVQFEVQYRDYGGEYEGTDQDLYLQEDVGKTDSGWQYKRILL